jgi:hypothetical protein
MSTIQQPPTEPIDKPKQWIEQGHNFRWTMLAIAASIVAMLTIASYMGDSSSGADQAGAQVMCERFIKDQLKSPGSADFSNEAATMGATNTLWEVSGDVDAQNSFGASLRSHFTCVVRYTPTDEYWHLVSLTGLN